MITSSARVRTVRMAGVLLGLLLLLLPLASCNQPTPPKPAFTALDLGIPQAALNSPVSGPLPDSTVLHVRITFKINPKLLDQGDKQSSQPQSPSKIEQLANKIGISDATYQKIKAFFSLQGISLKLSKLRTHLSIDAKASTFAKVFQTKFVTHQYNGRTFYAPATPPKVPTFLASSIDAITGLDNYSAAPIHALSGLTATPLSSHARQRANQDCSPVPNTLVPRQVAGAYGYDQLWQQGFNGENMTVNLVEIDGSYQSDIQNYLSCIQFKGHLNFNDVDGSPTDAEGESTLDIQMVAGLARAITINVYQTDPNSMNDPWVNVNDMLQQIINDNTNNTTRGSVVSISLGTSEQDMTNQDAQAIDSSLQQLTQAEHMTVYIASGDCGAFTSRVYGNLAVSFPASDPWAVAVGGTILVVNGNNQRVNEIVWSDGSNRSKCTNDWGSGGGNSTFFSLPSWQNANGVSNNYSKNRRQVPDISAVAYALAVYFNGRWGSVGGTSAAAPIWATGQALVNEGTIKNFQKFGYSPQLYYAVANMSGGNSSYFDVTRGNNLYYPATAGWDFSTGLGTPNLTNFYQAVSQLIQQG